MLWLDTETYNEVPIKHGTYKYTSTCEGMILTYAQDNEPVSTWDITADKKCPEYLEYLIFDTDEEITAHNAMFDRNVLKYALGMDTKIERWRCNMVRALAHALPGSLDALGEILGIPQDQRKHKEGKRLVQLFCKPRPANSKLRRATRETHPEEWQKFLAYAGHDIVSMRAMDSKLPRWNYRGEELALYHLDQVINDRGMYCDVELATAAVRAVERAKVKLAKRTREMTNEEVDAATKRDQLLAHILKDYGVELPDMQKSTIERRLNDPELPNELKELLAIRLESSATTATKYKALLNAVMPDHRLRGTLQFDGAGRTRRHAGRTFQPQNLKSRGLPKHEIIEAGIDAMKADCEDLIYENVIEVASNAIRGVIIAPPAGKLVIADLANIEGRDQAWFAGEKWKLQAFRDFDTVLGKDGNWYTGPEFYGRALQRDYIELELDDKGEPVRKGHDLYKLSYANSFQIKPEDVGKDERQIGKVCELMLGYAGGVGAWLTGAKGYGIDLDALSDVAYETLPGDIVHEAEGFLEWSREEGRQTYGLTDRAFITCDGLKRLWRRAHPAISSLWTDLEDSARAAILNPGETYECRKFRFRRHGSWLTVRMPSGRFLCYPKPRVDDNGTITYEGVNQYTRKWQRLTTYGGKLFENACQSFAGDLLKANWFPIEKAGYQMILSVHDENVTETPDLPKYDHRHLAALMAMSPAWAPDIPLAAAGFESNRYRK